MSFQSHKGFSLIELLTVIVILSLLSIIIVFGFFSLRENAVLESSSENIISLLNKARSKTLASEDASQYGVHFEADKTVLFKGIVFSAVDPDNQELLIPSLVEVSSISLNGGGQDVIFERLTGKTDNSGTITLRLKSDFSETRNVIIKPTGIVNIQ